MNANSNEIKQLICILWFRNDLRIHDNYILKESIELLKQKKFDLIVPFYCYDIDQLDGVSREAKIARCGPIRRNFIIECVENLKKNLNQKLQSNLFVTHGKPDLEIVKLIDHIQKTDSFVRVSHVISSKDVTTEEVNLENSLRRLLYERKISMMLIWDLTMIHPDDLPFDMTRDTIEFFMDAALKDDKNYNVRYPISLPANFSLPTYDPIKRAKWMGNSFLKAQIVASNQSKSSIENMKGGEDEALARLDHYFFKSVGPKVYKSTRNSLIGTDYSSKFSIWLAYGCISARYIYSKLREYEIKSECSNMSTKQFARFFLFRDHIKYFCYVYGRKIFFISPLFRGSMNQNNFESENLESEPSEDLFRYSKNTKWKRDRESFERWCKGETGYPFIDANMKELNETGYMSNRGRQNVGSFFAKDLEFDWRWGAEYFEKTLIDYDTAINWYMWRWVSGVGEGLSTEWHFNNVKQAYDFDPNGEYVKLWLPQLSKLPIELIHSPFRMSLTDQRRYNCILGKDYPEPIVRIKNEWKQISYDKATKVPSVKQKKSDFDRFNGL